MKTQNRLSIQACSKCDSDTIVSILHDAFTPVAQEFGLTNANCPNHTSFIRRENIEWELSNESKYFIGSINGNIDIGCISIKVDPCGEAEIKRLGVRPSFKGKGFGKQLVNFVETDCKNSNVKIIKLGMIAKHTMLHTFYLGLGYKDTGTEIFPHLPFQVLYMQKHI